MRRSGGASGDAPPAPAGVGGGQPTASAWRPRGRLARVLLLAVGVVVLVLVLAQIVLPKIAAHRISSRIGRYGKVVGVHVSAWPAIELLWHDAGSASVRASSLALTPSQTAKLLWEARGIDTLDLTAARASEGSLRLSEVSLRKRGSKLHAQGFVSEAGVHAALGEGIGVQLLGSSGGQVEVRASGGLFGIDASVDAVARASEGKLIVQPRGFLLEAFKLTLFAEPHVYVQGVGASARSGGYALSIDARLH
jgi:hypothetical protein